MDRLPLKITRQNYVELVGRGPTLIANPPTSSHGKDLYCGKLVEDVALLSKAYALIAKETKSSLDESAQREIASDFEAGVAACIKDFGLKCIVEISGREEPGVQIAEHNTRDENALPQIVRERLAIQLDTSLVSEPSTRMDRFGEDVQKISIALGPDERGFRKDVAVEACVDAIALVNRRLGYSGSDERTSDALD